MKIKPLLAGVAVLTFGAGLGWMLSSPGPSHVPYAIESAPVSNATREAAGAIADTPGAAEDDTALLYTGFWRGTAAPDAARMVTIFFDPLCPHCGTLWDELKEVDVPQYWIPVAVLKNGESAPLGAALNVQRVLKSPAQFEVYFDQLKAGEIQPGAVDDDELRHVQRNTLEFLKTGQTGVPVIVMSGADGKASIIRGSVPKETFLAKYEEFHHGKSQ